MIHKVRPSRDSSYLWKLTQISCGDGAGLDPNKTLGMGDDYVNVNST